MRSTSLSSRDELNAFELLEISLQSHMLRLVRWTQPRSEPAATIENGCNARPHPDLLPRGEGESFAGFLECCATEITGALSGKRKMGDGCSLSLGIQLLGFSQRLIKVTRSDIPVKLRHRKPCPTTVNTLGERIRVRRLEMRLTQSEMAGKLGISKFKLGLWERGHAVPTEAQRWNLVAVLGISA